MSAGLNKAIIIGNLGADPELKYTQGGTAVLNFNVAATENWFTKDGEKKERTEWLKIVVWGRRGEGLNKCLQKGSRVCVEGRIQTQSWTDGEGVKRYRTEIVATNVVLLGGGQNRDRSSESTGPRDESPADGPLTDDYQDGFTGDGIPF